MVISKNFSVLFCRVFFAAALLVQMSGCSGVTVPIPEDAIMQSLEVSYARSSLVESEFEHFKLQNNLLFVECGTLHRGRHRVEEQDLASIAESSVRLLRESAYPLYADLVSDKAPHLDEPGDANSFFDPGWLTIQITFSGKPVQIKTALDEAINPKASVSKKAQKLIEVLRRVARADTRVQTLCGNNEFYGLR